MTEKESQTVKIYNEFIKDNPDQNVFMVRHPRKGDDLITLVTTVTVFQQMFPQGDLRPAGKKENDKVETNKKIVKINGK